MFVLQLGLIGLCIALLPLSYVWVKADDNKFRKLVWVTTFLTFDLVVFGGFTRLTDSGLGCPDWPGCYAKANPVMAAGDLRPARAGVARRPARARLSREWRACCSASWCCRASSAPGPSRSDCSRSS